MKSIESLPGPTNLSWDEKGEYLMGWSNGVLVIKVSVEDVIGLDDKEVSEFAGAAWSILISEIPSAALFNSTVTGQVGAMPKWPVESASREAYLTIAKRHGDPQALWGGPLHGMMVPEERLRGAGKMLKFQIPAPENGRGEIRTVRYRKIEGGWLYWEVR